MCAYQHNYVCFSVYMYNCVHGCVYVCVYTFMCACVGMGVYVYISMVMNQNRLSFYYIFINRKVIHFAITHTNSKCLKHIIRKLFTLLYVRT